MKLSACLILRDEGKTIHRCLTSLLSIADEFVIGIDAQCTDNTKQEVERFLSENKVESIVYDYTWDKSFSKARNFGMDKATGTHILIMDGHEYFPEDWYNITSKSNIPVRKALIEVKKQIADNDFEEVHFQLYQQPFYGQTPSNFFLQPRIYKNTKEIRFGRDAHNTIRNVNQEKVVHFPEIILIHDAPEDNRKWRGEQRIEMNTKALREDIEKNPNDSRAMFYLGNTLLEAKKYDEAIEQYDNYLKVKTKGDSETYQVLLHQGLAYIEVDNLEEAVRCFHRAIGIQPNRRDGYIALGDLESKKKEWENAVTYYNQALNITLKDSNMFQGGPSQTWDPHQKIARAYKNLGKFEKSIAHLKIAVSYLDNKGWKDEIKELSKDKMNVLVIDGIGSFTKDLCEDLAKDKQINLVKIDSFDSGLAIWADRIFCEWGDQNTIEAVKLHAKKCIVRIHGYEAYTNIMALSQLKWDDVKKVIFVAEHIRKMFDFIPAEKCVVIPNGVDTDKFYIKNGDRDNRNIGYAGFINEKKNPFLLLKIIKANPDKIFHLRSDFQSPFWKATFDYELEGCKNVVYHGRYEDLSDFWNKMHGVLSTSIIESFSFNIAEAMACGCKPYIYNWKGAKEIWGERRVFEDMPEFSNHIEMEKSRKYITDNFNLGAFLENMKVVIFG
jgi:tetratricopeptide (TPR) repeat protein